MQYEFKNAVSIDGKIFPVGFREVPEKVENHPHFLKFVGAGYIVDADGDAVSGHALKSPKERAEALLDKVMNKKKSPKAAVAAATDAVVPASKVEEEAPESSDSVGDFMEAPQKSKKKK